MVAVTCQADDGQGPLIFFKKEKLTGGRWETEFSLGLIWRLWITGWILAMRDIYSTK
jgi:hypothetical protein